MTRQIASDRPPISLRQAEAMIQFAPRELLAIQALSGDHRPLQAEADELGAIVLRARAHRGRGGAGDGRHQPPDGPGTPHQPGGQTGNFARRMTAREPPRAKNAPMVRADARGPA